MGTVGTVGTMGTMGALSFTHYTHFTQCYFLLALSLRTITRSGITIFFLSSYRLTGPTLITNL